MKKFDLLVTAGDGRKFYQNFHVIESTAEAAVRYIRDNYPDVKIRRTVRVEKVEEIESADLFLPGIVFKSGRVYFHPQS